MSQGHGYQDSQPDSYACSSKRAQFGLPQGQGAPYEPFPPPAGWCWGNCVELFHVILRKLSGVLRRIFLSPRHPRSLPPFGNDSGPHIYKLCIVFMFQCCYTMCAGAITSWQVSFSYRSLSLKGRCSAHFPHIFHWDTSTRKLDDNKSMFELLIAV